jgi:pimeloyl-ACP methyl ester carboxylesterase
VSAPAVSPHRPGADDPWPTAYRPLRPASLLAQLVVLAVAELGLYSAYAGHDSRFHYATHLLVALIATAAFQAAFLLVAARPARGQLLAVLGFHLLAMWPDLVFRAGVPHYRWMDPVSLFHISSHSLPGGDTGWLLLAAAAITGYVLLLRAWLLSREQEASLGLPPALGVGGTAVWRPQLDPRSTPLAVRRTDAADAAAPRLVLVHGLGATSAVWDGVAGALQSRGRSSTAVDLLGYGDSLRMGTRFTVPDQAAALGRLLAEQAQPVVLVGHSWGCLVAARAALDAPDRVAALVLVSPAVFPDPETARDRIGRRSWLARRTLAGAPVAGLVCGAMCLLRPVLGRWAGHARHDLPEAVAHGGVQHTYPAYRDGLLALWQDTSVQRALLTPPAPTTVVLADDDRTVLPTEVSALPRSPAVQVLTVPGTHLLPIEDPALLAEVLADVP